MRIYKQRSTIRLFPGLVNSVPAVAYHFSLNLHVAFSQSGNGLIVKPSTLHTALKELWSKHYRTLNPNSSKGEEDISLRKAEGGNEEAVRVTKGQM